MLLFFFFFPQNNVAYGGWSHSIKLVCSLLPRLVFLPLSWFLMMTQCVWEGWSPSCIQPSTLNTSGQSHSTQTQTTISGCRHVLHTLIKHAVLSPDFFYFIWCLTPNLFLFSFLVLLFARYQLSSFGAAVQLQPLLCQTRQSTNWGETMSSQLEVRKLVFN